VSRINDHLGLRPAGQRSMMKLPKDRALRTALTSAVCPKCHQRGARISRTQVNHFWCSQPGCGHTWPMEDARG
jgi:hypothetical protein